jgi:hypothetical protein
MTFAEARADRTAMKKAHRARREAELGAKQRALPEKRYGVILADPPSRFEPYSRVTGMDRAAENHYPTAPSPRSRPSTSTRLRPPTASYSCGRRLPCFRTRGYGGVGFYIQNLRCVEQEQDRNWILVSQQARDFVGRDARACSGPRHGNAVAVAS